MSIITANNSSTPSYSANRPAAPSAAQSLLETPVDSFQASTPSEDPTLGLRGRMPGYQTMSTAAGGNWTKGYGAASSLWSVTSGPLEMGKGMGDLENGRILDAGVHLVSGDSKVIGGLGTGLATFGVGGTAMKFVGPGAFGVGAMAEGTGDMVKGWQQNDEQLMRDGGLKTAGGSFMLAGAVSLNPVLVGAGAVTYSAGWIDENKEPIAQGMLESGNTLRDLGTQVGLPSVGKVAGGGADYVVDKLADAGGVIDRWQTSAWNGMTSLFE